jgi:hypothetical protein
MFVTWDLRSVTIYKDLFIQRVEILEDNHNKKVLEDTVAHIFVRGLKQKWNYQISIKIFLIIQIDEIIFDELICLT